MQFEELAKARGRFSILAAVSGGYANVEGVPFRASLEDLWLKNEDNRDARLLTRENDDDVRFDSVTMFRRVIEE